MRRIQPWFIIAILLAGLHCSPGEPETVSPVAPDDSLAPPPVPDLSRLDDAVRRALEVDRAAMDEAVGDAARPAAERAEAFGKMGKRYHAYGMLESAEGCCRHAAALDPSDPRWSYYLGLVLLTDERLDEAAVYFERTHETAADVISLIRLGEIRFQQNRLDEALSHFERAWKIDEDNAAAAYGLGRIAVSKGDDAAAVRWFEKVLAGQPSATRVHYPLGVAYRNLGRLDRAEYHLARRGKVDVIVLDRLLADLSVTTRGPNARLATARTALKMGMLPTAVDEYRRAVTDEPSAIGPRLTLASTLARLGRFDEADRAYRDALEIEPGNAAIHFALADLLAARREMGGAERFFRSGLDLDPGNLEARVRLGWLMEAAERAPEALDTYDAVLAVDGGHVEALRRKSDLLIRSRRLDEAAATLDRWKKAAPDDPVPLATLATVIGEQGDLDGALRNLRAAANLDGDPSALALVHYNIAALVARRGDDAEAIENLRIALQLNPELSAARFGLVRFLSRTGDHEAALVELRTLVEVAPSDPAVRLALADSLVALGRYEEARTSLEESLAALDSAPKVADALARLLATCPSSKIRNGDRAVELARRAFETSRSPEHAETLAMAFAEAGDFDQAATWQRNLVAEAQRRGQAEWVARLRENLDRYERGLPSRRRGDE
jgi:tetratricopeptide (TPR) repeat protein